MNTLNRSFGVESLEARRLLSFSAPVNYTVGPSPQAVVTGDFNNDGKLDLAVIRGTAGTYWNNSMCVVLGNGDGTFKAPTALGSTWIPLAAAAGDFNADGNIDLVVGQDDTEGAGYVEVLLGNGRGGFPAASGESSAHSLPAPSLAVGDLNGDGKLDAVMVCGPEGSGGFAFLGNGNGTFGPYGLDWPQFDTAADPRAVKVGDFTGDGIPDLISAGQTVDVLRGHGDGSFDAPISQIANGAAHAGVATGDLNADGKLDAVVSDADTNTISLMLGNGDGTLRFVSAFAVGSAPEAIATGDFNADGSLDVAVANMSSNSLSVLLNDGHSAGKTYVGPNGGNWSSAGNWSPSGAPTASDQVTISGKAVNLTGNASVASLTLSDSASLSVAANGSRVLRASSSLISSDSKLNLNDNALILDYSGASPLDSIRAELHSGYANGAWNGQGINSSTAASLPGMGLGFAESSQLFTTFPASFAGQPVDATALVIRYTPLGDANLDGDVDLTDLGILATNWQGTNKTFSQGDFSYDGSANVADLGILATNWQTTVPQPSPPQSMSGFSSKTRRQATAHIIDEVV